MVAEMGDDGNQNVYDVAAALSVPAALGCLVAVTVQASRYRVFWQAAPLTVHCGLWICFSSLLVALWGTLSYLPAALRETGGFSKGDGGCAILAVLGQFGMVATVVWSGLAALMCGQLVGGWNLSAVKRGFRVHHIVAWLCATVLTILPAADRQMGPIDAVGAVCWIVGFHNGYRLTLTAPLIIATVTSLVVLVFVLINRSSALTSKPLERLVWFVLIFAVSWAPMAFALLAELLTGKESSGGVRGIAVAAMVAGSLINAVRIVTMYPFNTVFDRRRGHRQPVNMAQVSANVDSSISESEPIHLYFNSSNRSDDL